MCVCIIAHPRPEPVQHLPGRAPNIIIYYNIAKSYMLIKFAQPVGPVQRLPRRGGRGAGREGGRGPDASPATRWGRILRRKILRRKIGWAQLSSERTDKAPLRAGGGGIADTVRGRVRAARGVRRRRSRDVVRSPGSGGTGPGGGRLGGGRLGCGCGGSGAATALLKNRCPRWGVSGAPEGASSASLLPQARSVRR